jgi:hypothetical protein
VLPETHFAVARWSFFWHFQIFAAFLNFPFFADDQNSRQEQADGTRSYRNPMPQSHEQSPPEIIAWIQRL